MWVLLSALAWAGPSTWVGTVGTYPVRIVLDGRSGTLTTLRNGSVLQLSGVCKPSSAGRAPKRCDLDEHADGVLTGQIAASWSGEQLEGAWHKPDGGGTLPLRVASGPDAMVVDAGAQTWTRGNADKWSGTSIAVSLPRVWVTDPAVQAKIDALLVPERLVGDERTTVEADGWVDAVSFETTLQRAGVVSLRVRVEGSGAYPDAYHKAVVIDVRTGLPMGPDAFSATGRVALTAFVAAELVRRKAAADPEAQEVLAPASFAEAGLAGFWLVEGGLAVHLDWGLPHAFASAAPDATVVVPWSVVAGALQAGSALARLVP